MNRRAFLCGVAGVAACGALAGCTNNREVPETAPPPPPAVRQAARRTATGEGDPPARDGGGGGDVDGGAVENPESANDVVLAGQDVFATTGGDLVVTITARNDGTTRAVALVRVRIETDDGEVTVERFVDLVPGESTTVRFAPDVSYDAYGGHVPRILPETPATPLPTDAPDGSETEAADGASASDATEGKP